MLNTDSEADDLVFLSPPETAAGHFLDPPGDEERINMENVPQELIQNKELRQICTGNQKRLSTCDPGSPGQGNEGQFL